MANRCPKTGRFNQILLGDDGTMDTVVVCSECQQEFRYNDDGGDMTEAEYDERLDAIMNAHPSLSRTEARHALDHAVRHDFIEWAKNNAHEQHWEAA